MKYFNSLNCRLCNLPFAPIANEPRSPRKLGCGLAICHECFEKEKALKKEDRKHQCSENDCFANPNFVYFIIDLLSQDFLTLMATKSGYVLTKPVQRIECPICHEEYSLTESGKIPLDLHCNHTICNGCFSIINKLGPVKRYQWEWTFDVTCPICQVTEGCTNRNNSLIEFLRELPEMITQYEQGNMSTQECAGCNILDHIERMLNCSDCSVKICGTCAFFRHRQHKVDHLAPIEVNRISNEVRNVATTQIGGYEKFFAELHTENKKIINDLKMKLIDKADEIKELVKLQEVHKEQQEIEELGDKFEAISEEYMPQIRGFNSKLQDLLGQLEKDEKAKESSRLKK